MYRMLSYGLVVLLAMAAKNSLGHGLRIKGNSYAIEDRTAVDLFHFRSSLQHRKLFKQFVCQFEFRLDEPQGHGNLMRIKLDEPNKTLNVFCRRLDDGRLEIKLVEEGLDQLGAIFIEPKHVGKDQWIQLLLDFDLGRQVINWHVLDKIVVVPFPYQTLTYDNVYFGKSDFSIDIADFSIRNLSVSLDSEERTFPLRESRGHTIHGLDGKPFGKVENPVWLINESYYWQVRHTVDMPLSGGYQFDAINGQLLFFDKNEFSTLDLASNTLGNHRFPTPLPIDIRLGNSFLRNGKLYIYEVNDLPIGAPTVVEVDLETQGVDVISTDFVPMQLHHHTGQTTARTPYVLFGGFGNDRYSNQFLTLDIQNGRWDTVATSGDHIMPRYFTSSFYESRTNHLYLFGGMGNEVADNTIGRVYRYDLYRLNLATYRLERLWEWEWANGNVVPVRNMVYDGTSAFYTLLYPEYRSASALQLYRFSVENGNHVTLGDSIPISSEKIKTNANLFFYQPMNTFYTVTQVFDSEESSSTITVYELKAPAVSHSELIQYDTTRHLPANRWLPLLVGLLGVSFIGYWFYRWRVRKSRYLPKVQDSLPAPGEPAILPASNAIYLFGKFEVFDKKGGNISHLFSGRLKHVLILFLSRSHSGGITSTEFSRLLWPEKEFASTKNIRGVTLNQFRKLLAELEGILLAYQEGHYRLEATDCFVDYLHFMDLHESASASHPLCQAILGRGKFLRETEHEMLDTIKNTVDESVVQQLQLQLEQSFEQGAYAHAIRWAKLCLETSPVHFEAFRFEIRAMLQLGQRAEASRRFEHYAQFYKNLMNESLPFTFKELDKRKL